MFAGCLVISVSVLVGWVLGIPMLKSLSPDWVEMKMWTATTFVMCATSGLISKRFGSMGVGLGVFAGMVNLLGPPTTVFHMFEMMTIGGDSGVMTAKPGMPSICTFTGFVVFGIGVVLREMPKRNPLYMLPAWFLALAPLPVTLAYVAAVVTGSEPSHAFICYDENTSTAMAAHTAICFSLLGLGMIMDNRSREEVA